MSKSSEQTTFNKKEAMLTALQANYGAVSKAAKTVLITPQTHYNWYKNDEVYRESVDTIKYQSYEEYKEMVLEAMLKKLNEGSTSVINKCIQTMFAKWAEQMERGNPYRGRLIVKIKPADKSKYGNL